VCPAGWHIPSDAEWTTLTNYAGGLSSAGNKLKSRSGWSNSGNGADDYGLRVLPAGSRKVNGSFEQGGSGVAFWSASEFNSANAWYLNFESYSDGVNRFEKDKTFAFSLRCVEN
jgi:uncharacterized protein (TIGR02145 family)